MKWPWSHRPMTTTHLEPPSTSPSLASFLGLTGPSTEDFVRSRVAELAQAGSLDAANGDVLDAWLDRLRSEWHAQCAVERTERIAAADREVGRLEAESLAAKRRADAAAAELDRTEKFVAVAERSVLEPAEAVAGDKRERRRRPRPTVDSLEGLERRWWHGLFLKFLVLMAAIGDVVTFNVTLQGFFKNSGPLVAVGPDPRPGRGVRRSHAHGGARASQPARGPRGPRPSRDRRPRARLAGDRRRRGRLPHPGRDTTVTTQQSAFGTDTTAAGAGRVRTTHCSPRSCSAACSSVPASSPSTRASRSTTHNEDLPVGAQAAAEEAGVGHAAGPGGGSSSASRWSTPEARPTGPASAPRMRSRLADATIAELKELVRVEISAHLGMPEATTGLMAPHGSHGEEPDSVAVAIPKPRPAAPDVAAPKNWVVPPTTLWGGEQSANGHGALNGHGPADAR